MAKLQQVSFSSYRDSAKRRDTGFGFELCELIWEKSTKKTGAEPRFSGARLGLEVHPYSQPEVVGGIHTVCVILAKFTPQNDTAA